MNLYDLSDPRSESRSKSTNPIKSGSNPKTDISNAYGTVPYDLINQLRTK